MLDLDRLHAFVTVARTQNVTRAAELLHVSQSPLSRQILALERSLGVPLFARERKRLRLTPAGRAFLADAEGLLRAAQSVEQRARAWGKGEAGHLTIGYVAGAIYAGVLVRALEQLRRRAPHATLELRPMRSHEQIEALASGEIDVGYAYAPGEQGTLLATEPFVLAAPRGARARQAKRLLETHPLITLPEAFSPKGHAELLAACARLGVRAEVRIEAADPAVVLTLVGAGLGVALVQIGLMRHAPRSIRFVRLPAAFGLDVRIYRLVRGDASSLVESLGA
jgi:DNA-binding transcriptional LysR family regulator